MLETLGIYRVRCLPQLQCGHCQMPKAIKLSILYCVATHASSRFITSVRFTTHVHERHTELFAEINNSVYLMNSSLSRTYYTLTPHLHSSPRFPIISIPLLLSFYLSPSPLLSTSAPLCLSLLFPRLFNIDYWC